MTEVTFLSQRPGEMMHYTIKVMLSNVLGKNMKILVLRPVSDRESLEKKYADNASKNDEKTFFH